MQKISPTLDSVAAFFATLVFLLHGCGTGIGPPLGFEFQVQEDQVFLSAEQRNAAGYTYFPDGLMGLTKVGGAHYIFAPSGGDKTQTTQGTWRFTASDISSFDNWTQSPSGTEKFAQREHHRKFGSPEGFARYFYSGS